MQRFLFLALIIIVISSLLIAGCGEPEETSTQPTSTQPTSTQPTSTQPTSTQPPTTTAGPTTGGILRVIYLDYPSNLSYIPEQNLTDESMAKAYAETLIYWAGDGEFKPELAKSWDINDTNKTLTFYLQEGVTFHDGTPFNSQAVYDNVQLLIDSQRLANGQYVDSIEVVDEYTFRYNLNAVFTPQMMLHSYGYNLLTMFSPTALEQNGSEWAASHYVSTGPFKFESFERDVLLKMTRYDNYWRGGQYPYLDAIEIIFVADSTIAATKLQAGEGDICRGLPLKEVIDMENLGYTIIPQKGGFYSDLIPDTKSESSIYQDKLIREAIEYAINRDAMAAALGYGKEKAIKSLGPEGSQGYDPNFQIREYNPEKALELMAQAGHPDGFSTTIYQMQGSTDATEIIQKFLGDVNIVAEIQVEDPGKFIGRIYGEGWENGLLFFSVPVDPEFAIGWFVHFGPQPIFPYVSLQWPDGYYDLVEKVRLAPTIDEMHDATREMMTFLSEDAIIIPLMSTTGHQVTESYVHTTMNQDHFMVWHNYMDWMEK
jgi:peptide/nickel transport system substrate-binding protein